MVTATKELADYIDYQKHFEVNGRFIFAQKHHSSHKKIFGPSHRNHESSYNDSGKSWYKDSCPSSKKTQWTPNLPSELSKIREFMKNDPEFLEFKKFKEQ